VGIEIGGLPQLIDRSLILYENPCDRANEFGVCRHVALA
jgi:hypothetical protein